MEKAKRAPFAFSWADEVEREEREGEQQSAAGEPLVDERTYRKPNPFGDARPREVVLEERGVNWRNNDRDFNPSSVPRKEKKLKENTFTVNTSVNRNEQLKCSGSGSAHNPIPQPMAHYVHSEQQEQSSIGLVPPLKYPPKNIGTLMEEIHRIRHADKLEMDQEKFHKSRYSCEFDIVREREHFSYERRAQHFSTNELMSHEPIEMAHSMKNGVKANMDRRQVGAFTSHAGVGVLLDNHLISEGENLELETKRGKQFEKKFSGTAREMHSIGRRSVLVDMNMERSIPDKRDVDGEGYYSEYIEEEGRKRKDLVVPQSVPHGRKHSYKVFSFERCRFGSEFEGAGLRTDAVVNELRNVGGLVDHSTTAVAGREKGRKDQHKFNIGVKDNLGNNKKKKEMPSEPNRSSRRKRRHRNHVPK